MAQFRLRSLPVAAALLALSLPGALAAQACVGNPSYANGHLQLTTQVQTSDDVTMFVGALGGGSQTLFGNVGVGGAQLDGVDGTQLQVGGNVGYQVAVSDRVQVCPVMEARLGFGPSDIDGRGTDLGIRTFGFGLNLGGELMRNERLALIPSVSLGFAHVTSTLENGGTSTSSSDSYGLTDLSLGILVSDQLSLRPTIRFPFGGDSNDPVYGIGFSLNYGGRR